MRLEHLDRKVKTCLSGDRKHTFALLSQTARQNFDFVLVVVQRDPRSAHTDHMGQWTFDGRLPRERGEESRIFGQLLRDERP